MIFIAAKATANAIISRNISYELLKIIVVSEKYAKDKNFLQRFTDVLKDKEIRLNSYLAVSKEKASEYFLNNHPKMETRPHKYFQYMIDHGIENGLFQIQHSFVFLKQRKEGQTSFWRCTQQPKGKRILNIKREDEYIAGQVECNR